MSEQTVQTHIRLLLKDALFAILSASLGDIAALQNQYSILGQLFF